MQVFIPDIKVKNRLQESVHGCLGTVRLTTVLSANSKLDKKRIEIACLQSQEDHDNRNVDSARLYSSELEDGFRKESI